MKKHTCMICGHTYDPELGDIDCNPVIPPGTTWEEVPEDWTCPVCGVGKESFEEE